MNVIYKEVLLNIDYYLLNKTDLLFGLLCNINDLWKKWGLYLLEPSSGCHPGSGSCKM